MRCRLALSVLISLSGGLAQTPAPAKHPFRVDDWAALRSARAIAVSPNGKDILYQVSFGAEKGHTNYEWHLIHPDGTEPRKLDTPADFEPSGFTRDGAALYGTFKINGKPQFAVFALDKLNAQSTPTITVLLPNGAQTVMPSPDAARYAILADPRPSDPLANVRTVVEPEQTSLYVVNADGTHGQWWCPDLKYIENGPVVFGSMPIAWSADSASIATVSTVPKMDYHYVRSFIDICSTSGTRRIADIPNSISGVGFADNGRDLAFLSTTTSVLTPDHVWIVPLAAGGAAKDVTPQLNASAVELESDPHGNVWVLVNRGVQNEVDAFRDGALTPAYHWPNGIIEGLPAHSNYASASPQLAFTVGDPTHSANIVVPANNTLKKITSEGDDQLAKVDFGAVRTVHWASKADIALEGIATFPAGYQQGQKYPFLVLPHGGPEANDLLAFDPLSRIIAGYGYVVLQPEYRGSTGYGSAFLDDIYQHFGDRAYQDVDSATDYAIAQGWADPNRLAIFGWSAGGFMTSWTVTQTGRYHAAIEGAGITDWSSFIWTSDVQQIDFDARWPSENPEAFRKFSPGTFADKVTTPLLIEHGGADRRVPTFQGQEFFEALKARGKTVRFVTYPGSPHFPVLWEQRIDVFHEIDTWLKKYNP